MATSDELKAYYLHHMGIQSWTQREQNSMHTPNSDSVIIQPTSELDWEALQARVSQCIACSLHQSRTQTVFGVGNRQAELMLIGEAPGATEDRLGEPFVGRAGQLLDAMLASIGLHRNELFIANILKCRPPHNRDPNQTEMKECTPYLERQIALIKPKLLVALGRIAAHYLLDTTTSLAKLRGRFFTYGANQTPLMVTYHPAYLLRNPIDKRKAYEDLLTIKNSLNHEL